MKKLQIVMVLAIVLMLVFSINAFAMTESDLVSYICEAHSVNGGSFQLSSADQVKVKRYFSNHSVTEEEANQIKAKLDDAVAYIGTTGATSLSGLTGSEKTELLSKVNSAASVIGVSLVYNSSDKAVDVYKDGEKIESLTDTATLVQTGSSNYQYLIIPAVLAVVAIAGVIYFVKKNKVAYAA
jgi:cobalamin biosynthesis Mg chelatase CobN